MVITFEYLHSDWIFVRVPNLRHGGFIELQGWDDGVWTAVERYSSGQVYRYQDYENLYEAMRDIRERWIPGETLKG